MIRPVLVFFETVRHLGEVGVKNRQICALTLLLYRVSGFFMEGIALCLRIFPVFIIALPFVIYKNVRIFPSKSLLGQAVDTTAAH